MTPEPVLWNAYSPTASIIDSVEAPSPSSGPAVTLTGLIPDQTTTKGHLAVACIHSGVTALRKQPNIKPALLTHLAKVYGQPVKAEDVMAYLAAVMAHPAFTARFEPISCGPVCVFL